MNVGVRLDRDTSVRSEIYTGLTGQKNTNEARLPVSYAFAVQYPYNQQLRSSRSYKTAAIN